MLRSCKKNLKRSFFSDFYISSIGKFQSWVLKAACILTIIKSWAWLAQIFSNSPWTNKELKKKRTTRLLHICMKYQENEGFFVPLVPCFAARGHLTFQWVKFIDYQLIILSHFTEFLCLILVTSFSTCLVWSYLLL